MRYIILLITLLLSAGVCGQELPEGIGPYKIGKLSTGQLDSIAKVQKLRLIECVGKKCLLASMAKPKTYIKTKPNFKDLTDNSYNTYFLDNIVQYTIKNLIVNNKYTIELAQLIFLDDKLIFLYFSNPSGHLSSDFETKFGLGILSKHESDDYCYINNEKFPYVKKRYYREYFNGNILINRIISDGKDEDCNQDTSLFFIGEDTVKRDEIDEKSKSARSRLDDLENEERRKSLKDL